MYIGLPKKKTHKRALTRPHTGFAWMDAQLTSKTTNMHAGNATKWRAKTQQAVDGTLGRTLDQLRLAKMQWPVPVFICYGNNK
jgi:hypothetical protein